MVGKKRDIKTILREFKEYFFILLGIVVAGFGIKGFLIPNGFIDGGITGVSLLVHFLTPISVSILIFAINIPFIFLAAKQVSKVFAIKTFIAIMGLSICLLIVEYPVITSDKLLVSVFGGFLLGSGIGLSMRGGGVLDGTEVLSIYLSKKVSMSVGEILFAINVVIFSFAAFLLSVEVALYSILIYLTASKTMDFIITGVEEYIGLTIISKNSDRIRKRLIGDFKKGVTIYKGKGGYSEEDSRNIDIDIIYTIVTRFEVSRIKSEIKSMDPSAFIIEQSLNEVSGGVVKKRPFQ
ncbi:MAG: YitT family protein [Nanoarchaeota archaeon]|nr:YitT family protein [Nanoarchaeota archaeon]